MAARVEAATMDGEIDEEENDERGSMWDLDQKLDQSMDEEAGRLRNMYREKKFSALLLLQLSFQSLGVVYGDLGTSPLYVFYNTFPHGIKDQEDIIGALSLIIYSLTLIPLLKYVFVVCKANDNGQGGTFALYSLLCRHAKVKTIQNQHRTDEELTTYSRTTFHEHSFAAKTKRWLEKRTSRKTALLILVLVGTCMVIGDGILTPAISVLSAAGGLRVNLPHISNGVVVFVAVVILVSLFSVQHYGTDRVGWLFAPIVFLWFLSIASIGIYNIWKHDTSVLKAFSPVYIYRYFKRGGRDRWTSLGGIMLSITGIEALFADLSHFPVSAVQIAFTVIVFPCLLLAYSGQAAYIRRYPDHVADAFYRSIPGSVYWPMFIIATAAAIVASQATISATFSLVKQALAHVWRCHWVLVLIFTILSLVVECTYFSAMLFKIDQGGWVPLVIAAAFLLIMSVWHYGTLKRYEFEMHSRVSMAWILGLGPSLGLVRNLPVYTVPEEERFLVKRIGPKNFHMFRCVARYGYRDLHKKDDDFEKRLFESLFLYVRLESMMEGGCSDSDDYSICGSQQQLKDTLGNGNENENLATFDTFDSIESITPVKRVSNTVTASSQMSGGVDELEFINGCRDAGVVHIMGNTVVRARREARFYKKIAIDYVYAFLRKICREHSAIYNVPQESLLNVGQIFYV
ncbi:unnamed protein product [Arabidopsis arenosa]|uniref:Potassium transporter n=1 Tax=Arabidopsis arenosa TaxID=38785 RepID=A0A8S2A3R4_ARAAE|nr:unnamed protein product [Arabidopsis arenosa]